MRGLVFRVRPYSAPTLAPEFEHIMGQAHQTPFAPNLLQPPEQEAAKTSHFFDLAKHGFHNDLAPSVQRTALRRAHFRGHLLLRCGGWSARRGLWGMMPLAPRGYVRIEP